MNRRIFITGIGTGVGKTLAAAIITEALQADYWKPIQAGLEGNTDTVIVKQLLSNTDSVVHPELYRLYTPASPHIAAKIDEIMIDGNIIAQKEIITEEAEAYDLSFDNISSAAFVEYTDGQNSRRISISAKQVPVSKYSNTEIIEAVQ